MWESKKVVGDKAYVLGRLYQKLTFSFVMYEISIGHQIGEVL